MRRVVITGMGLVTPLANGREASWKKLIAGESGLGPIDMFDTSDLACKIAGQVPWISGRGGGKADDPDIVQSREDDVAERTATRRRVHSLREWRRRTRRSRIAAGSRRATRTSAAPAC